MPKRSLLACFLFSFPTSTFGSARGLSAMGLKALVGFPKEETIAIQKLTTIPLKQLRLFISSRNNVDPRAT